MYWQRGGKVNMFVKIKALLWFLFLTYQKVTASNENNITNKAYKELFKRTITGYDCSQIKNITSHKTTEIKACEDDIIHKVRTNIEVQILQKSDKFRNKALTCSMRRTKKLVTAEHITTGLI